MSERDSLGGQAQQFADDLTASVEALVPGSNPFKATSISKVGGKEGFAVRQQDAEGITLTVDGVPLIRLTVAYWCSFDHGETFLAVDKANIAVFADGDGVPLFRYEYLRDAAVDMPAAHIQVHAHRDAATWMMSKAGRATKRGKRRAKRDELGRLEDLHFPVGGRRFRPCLEDVLEMLVHELGVDCDAAGRDALRGGRERWRRKQVRSVVRDAPQEAIEELGRLGYDVSRRDGDEDMPVNLGRLRDF